MQTKTEIRTAVGLILTIQIVISFAVIALLNRMNALYQTHLEKNLVALNAAQQAQNLAQDGAWAAAFLGAASFGLVILTLLYIKRRIINPIQEIYQTAIDYQQGNLFRRCTTVKLSPELAVIAHTMNTLLDEHQFNANRQTPLTTSPLATSRLERTALLNVLDRSSNPTLVFDSARQLIAANHAASELQDDPQDQLLSHATQALKTSPQSAPPGILFTELPNQGWIVEIDLDNI